MIRFTLIRWSLFDSLMDAEDFDIVIERIDPFRNTPW